MTIRLLMMLSLLVPVASPSAQALSGEVAVVEIPAGDPGWVDKAKALVGEILGESADITIAAAKAYCRAALGEECPLG